MYTPRDSWKIYFDHVSFLTLRQCLADFSWSLKCIYAKRSAEWVWYPHRVDFSLWREPDNGSTITAMRGRVPGWREILTRGTPAMYRPGLPMAHSSYPFIKCLLDFLSFNWIRGMWKALYRIQFSTQIIYPLNVLVNPILSYPIACHVPTASNGNMNKAWSSL